MGGRNGALIDPDKSLDDQAEDGEEEGEEGKRLEGVLLAAAGLAARVGRAAGQVVVVLGFEDDSCEPQVGVEQVERDPVPGEALEKGGDKWGNEECDTSGCNDFIIDDVLAGRELVNKVGRNAHDNHSAGPLHDPGAEEGGAAGKHSEERHCFFLLLKCGSSSI